MTSLEQICIVRSLYSKCRERYYEKNFIIMFYALSKKNPDYYRKRIDFIYALMQIAENALIRGEISRGLRYVLCFQNAMNSLEKRMKTDSERYFRNLPVE